MLWFRGSRRLDVLEDDLKRLQRDFQALELEWGNVYDKLRKAMGRIVKSRAIIEAREDAEEAVGPKAVPSNNPPGGGFLNPRQKEIQQQILRRRAGG